MTYSCTPEHALEKLLEHGALTFSEVRQYSCWDHEKVRLVALAATQAGTVTLHTDWSGAKYWNTLQLRTHLALEARRRGEAAVTLTQRPGTSCASTWTPSADTRMTPTAFGRLG